MPTQIQWMAAGARLRMFRLRPCATVAAGFVSENAVMYLVDRMLVFAIIVLSVAMAAFVVWRGGSPLSAVEVVAGAGFAAATTVRMLSKAN